MRTSLFFLVLVLTAISSTTPGATGFLPPASDRVKANIDFDWKFFRGDFPCEEETHQVNELPWQKVDLPHDWSIEGPFSREHNTTQGFLPMEIGWYKKDLFLPECYEDKKIFIIFDGVYRGSDVWMNYAYLGHHESGYTSFIYDITDYVRFANRIPNGLRVRVDGRRHEQDMYEGSGIYRHVWLLITHKLYLPYWGTFVSTTQVSKSKATLKVQVIVKNDYDSPQVCNLDTKIVDAAGMIVAEGSKTQKIASLGDYEFIQEIPLLQPQLWSIDNPYLYKAYHIVSINNTVVDVYETPFGIRTIHFDPDKGFFLNGQHLKLKGFNAHYDYAGLGTALPDRIHWNAMTAMKRAGFNFYRSSHNPATPERLQVCDQIGMLVWDEIERKLESADILLPLVQATITRDRNHPSIILWSLENESPLESTVFGTQILQQGTKLAHQLDPTRLTTFAASMPVNNKGYGDAVDVVSYNYHLERADQDHLAHPHWKIGLISEYSAARARRGVYGFEYFARAEDDAYFDLYNGMVQTMYEMCSTIEGYWQRIQARDYLGGGCLWSGIDAWGEGNAWPLISRGDGVLDLCFFPKDAYYYFMAQWTEEPMVHIFPHWNWQEHAGQVIDVWGYSNCDSVELFLNNRSVGIHGQPSDPEPWHPEHHLNITAFEPIVQHLAWKVPYEPGTLRAVGFRNSGIVCSQEIHTAGEPTQIKLDLLMTEFIRQEQMPPLIADGRDLVVVTATVLDRHNHIVPTANNLVNFSVVGNGKIIGVGNGNITSHEANKATFRHVYNGLCAAIIQSTKTPGPVVVTATAEGLNPGEITVTSVPPVPEKIAVFATPYRLTAQQNAAIITAEIRDKFGVVIPSATNQVTFSLEGPALFENGVKSLATTAKDGLATAKITRTSGTGNVTITVASAGLTQGKVTVILTD